MSEGAILETVGISKAFGGLRIVRDLSFAVRRGEATALIGPNGAGKTTVFNVISGVFPPSAGRIFLNGNDITSVPSRRRIHLGLGRSFQNVRLMAHLTVAENLIVGLHVRAGGLLNLLTPFRLMPGHRWRGEAIDALAEAGLEAYADATVSELPYGLRKRIDLVRATMATPSFLMLDEPAAGLNPTETNALGAHLEALKQKGITLLVVEHDMHFIDAVCDHVIVLNFGVKIAEGRFADVRRDSQVRAAYLGLDEAA